MKITKKNRGNTKIEIIELSGDLIGSCAIELLDYLCVRLDKRESFQLIDFKGVQSIDGLGAKVICDFIERGMQIALFNVDVDVLRMLKLSGKEGMEKIYNESDIDTVINMFEKTTLDAKNKKIPGIKNRLHTRITTDFEAEFKYHPGHNGVISGRTRVINLSEGGLMADNILAVHEKTEKLSANLN